MVSLLFLFGDKVCPELRTHLGDLASWPEPQESACLHSPTLPGPSVSQAWLLCVGSKE